MSLYCLFSCLCCCFKSPCDLFCCSCVSLWWFCNPLWSLWFFDFSTTKTVALVLVPWQGLQGVLSPLAPVWSPVPFEQTVSKTIQSQSYLFDHLCRHCLVSLLPKHIFASWLSVFIHFQHIVESPLELTWHQVHWSCMCFPVPSCKCTWTCPAGRDSHKRRPMCSFHTIDAAHPTRCIGFFFFFQITQGPWTVMSKWHCKCCQDRDG